MRFSRFASFVILVLAVVTIAAAQGPPGPPSGPPPCWPPIPSGLVDWWTFDEPSGPTSSDFGGLVNNIGNDHGTVPRVAGEVGRAVSFNGGSNWIEVANGNEVNFLGDCANDGAEAATIDFWIRTTQASGVVTILDKRDSTGSNFLRGYSVYLWNGHLGFHMATGPGNSICNTPGSACSNSTATTLPSVANGQWHFVAIAFSRCRGAAGMFFVDGATAPFTPRVGNIVSTSNLFIGRLVPAMGKGFFIGAIDELEFFKAVLTPADLNGIYNKKSAGKCR